MIFGFGFSQISQIITDENTDFIAAGLEIDPQVNN